MRTSVILFLACLALGFSNCKKKSLPVVNMDTDSLVKVHFNFQPGTYWIYRDSATKRIDSFYVVSNNYSKQGNPTEVLNYHLLTIADVTEDTSSASIADSAKWVWDFEGSKVIADYYYYYDSINNKWLNDVGYNPLFNYGFVLGNMNGEYNFALVTQIDSADSINHAVYYKVAHIHQFLDADSTAKFGITKIDDWFYINDSVGIVKMDLYHPYHSVNRKWQLLRCNIVK